MPGCANHPDVISGLAVCSTCGGTFCPNCFITLQGRTVCASCKGGRVQDIKSNAAEDIDLAGRGARFGAQFIDGMLMMLVFFPVAIAFGLFSFTDPKVNESLMSKLVVNLLPSVVLCVYEAQLLLRTGQTLGKMALKIRVVQADGSDLTSSQCWRRAISRVVLQITQIGGLIDALMIFSEQRTTLHDRFAKTRVVNWRR